MKADVEKEAGALLLKDYGSFFKKQYHELLLLTDGQSWESNKTYFPIKAQADAKESVPVIQLVSSDNLLMTKILGVLSYLCVETTKLKKEAKERHFCFLAAYSEYEGSGVGQHMQALCRVTAFATRCKDTLQNLCNQLFSLYATAPINLSGVQLHYVISHVGELFTLLVTLEHLIANSTLPRNWTTYRKNIKAFSHVPEKLGFTTERLNAVLGAVENIDTKMMSDNIVQCAMNSLLVLRQKLVEKNCSVVAAEFNQYIRLAISSLDKSTSEQLDLNLLHKCIKVNALFVLNSHLFGVSDKKNFKALVDLNVKAHSVPLYGTAIWFPEQFLQRYVPSQCANYAKLPQTMIKARQSYVNNKKMSIVRDEASLQCVCSQWVLNVESSFSETSAQLNAADMSYCVKVLLNGLDIASQTNYFLKSVVKLHLSQGLPLSKSMLMSIFRMLETLKGLKDAVLRNHVAVMKSVDMIVQHLVFQAISSVVNIKKNLMSDKNYARQRLDELTCVVVAERALRGAATVERNVVANVALSLLPHTTYADDNYSRLAALLEKIDTVENFISTLDNLCNGAWIFWHKDIIPLYLEQNFSFMPDVLRLKLMLQILEDCGVMLNEMDQIFAGDRYNKFNDSIKSHIEESVLKSASQHIETNLRLHIHSHLQLDVVNPFSRTMINKSILVIDKFRLLQTYMSVVPSVEHYLSTMYYNLTTVILSDWKTYGEMRQMAKFKFGLQTVEDNLPTQTLEQGLDVLEIMRNIHIFVSKYLYNLNNQIFVEKSSNNKHLDSINIRHVANSIRTHGTGVMSTTVNFTYQFLKKKFYTFSQFMYDEHIKSRLIKDLRFFKDNALVNSNMYSYKNAEKFNKGIRNLGIGENGQSYLDLFRDLISQIGNAMGYVRMIRSGGRHCCADATVFLPTLDRDVSLKELCQANDLSSTSLASADNLDHDIDNLITNFTQGTEYFELLVDVFAPVFRNPKNVHLKNFFVIVPPLTLNFVEHLILSKDKMTKKNKVGAAFTDDGFAMGVAYILKLLDQDSDLDSLHWFESVWKHIATERQSLEEQKSKGSVQLQQTLALTEKKLTILEQEFQLLYYSFSSARIFFQ